MKGRFFRQASGTIPAIAGSVCRKVRSWGILVSCFEGIVLRRSRDTRL